MRHLFEPSDVSLVLRRQSHLREFMFDFAEMFAPHISRPVLEKAIFGKSTPSAAHALPEL